VHYSFDEVSERESVLRDTYTPSPVVNAASSTVLRKPADVDQELIIRKHSQENLSTDERTQQDLHGSKLPDDQLS
jgi:hypothetical protein